jgi:hypothetical protein
MAFQKRDGTDAAGLWIEAAGFDRRLQADDCGAATDGAHLSATALPLARSYRWREDGNVLEDATGAGQTNLNVTINDALTVLQFGSPRRAVPRQVENLRIVK